MMSRSLCRPLVATLHPSPSQTEIILETTTRCNWAANEVAALAYTLGRAYHRELSAHLYDDLRRRYELPSNLVLYAITKVVRRFHLDGARQPWFPDHAGLSYEGSSFLLFHIVEVPVIPAPPLRSASALRERFTAL